MAGKNNIYNKNDSMDINELASLDEEISPELIEQLQMKLSKEANEFTGGSMSSAPIPSSTDDASLFEEPAVSSSTEEAITVEEPVVSPSTEKAITVEEPVVSPSTEEAITVEEPVVLPSTEETITVEEPAAEAQAEGTPVMEESVPTENPEPTPKTDANVDTEDGNQNLSLEDLANINAGKVKKEDVNLEENFDDNFIKKYKAKLKKQSQGSKEDSSDEEFSPIKRLEESSTEEESRVNITERAITQEQKEYNKSLDFLDGNVKYSKYVIYIDPENVDFIEGLTVKERKNLVNSILKNQNDISVTKQRLKIIQSVIIHIIVMILTIAISIPLIYYAINASLETSINNYRRSQSNFQVLYREKGKITNMKTR